MEIGSIGKNDIRKKVEKIIKSQRCNSENLLNLGKNLADMTKGNREENTQSFQEILEEQQEHNKNINDGQR